MSRRTSTRQPRPSWVIARTDLRQLLQARDFWLPLMIVALLFFVIIPTFLLLILGSVKDANLAKKLSDVVGQPAEGPAGERARPEGPGERVVRAGRLPLRTARDHRAADGVVGGRRAHDRR